jgi:hypothetical protein
MMKNIRLLMIALVVLNLWGCASDDPKNELRIDRTNLISAEAAIVEAVNMQTRMVTLRTPEGKSFTVYVSKDAINLPQVRVGDQVRVEYSEALAVRMAQPGEVRDETSLGVGRAAPGNKPGGFEVIETTVTAKIEGMDKIKELVSLRLPDGGLRIVKVQDPANLEKVKVGDTIVITYTEAFAISVRKI